jgi:hypothetical protein
MTGLLTDWQKRKEMKTHVSLSFCILCMCACVFGVVLKKKRRRKRRETVDGLVSIARQRFQSITIPVEQ